MEYEKREGRTCDGETDACELDVEGISSSSSNANDPAGAALRLAVLEAYFRWRMLAGQTGYPPVQMFGKR